MTDLLDLLDDMLAPAPTAPFGFTLSTDFTPAEFEYAYERRAKRDGQLGVAVWSHQWHATWCGPTRTTGAHPCASLTVSLRCQHEGTNRCHCVKSFLYRIYCHSCAWWTPVRTDENLIAEDYHDHCWPGWRDLPIDKPTESRTKKWTPLPRDEQWTTPGAPILTARTGLGTRHVPDRSPWGGYDLGIPVDSD